MVGSQVTNRVRLAFALIYLAIVNLILFREPLPFTAESSRWMWLSISGVVGLALGDAFLFQSYVEIGPRLGILLLSTSPIFSSAIAWIFFGETLTLVQIIGIGLALVGLAWVVLSHGRSPDAPQGRRGLGVLFGLLGGLGQAVGLVLSKQGMVGDFDPFRGNVIRMLAALLLTWLFTMFQRQAGSTLATLRQKPQSIRLIAAGAVVGPLLGVSASLVAVQHADIGVASTLMALSPVVVLPLSYFAFKEKVSWQAIAGTMIAFAGVAVLFLA